MTTILNISIVLRLRIHVFYGSSLCTCVSGRPRNVCQRARQRPLWTFAIYGIELSYWPPISMYVCRVTVQFLSLLLTKVAVLISVLFSVISYWLSNFYPNADAFFTWVMWIFWISSLQNPWLYSHHQCSRTLSSHWLSWRSRMDYGCVLGDSWFHWGCSIHFGNTFSIILTIR